MLSRSAMSDSAPMDCKSPPFQYTSPLSWDPSGKNPGVRCHALLQGFFPAPEYYPRILLFCLLHPSGGLPGPANMCTSWERSSSLGSRPWQWLLALQKILRVLLRFPWWLRESSVCLWCRRPGFDPWVGKIPWRRKWQPTPVLLPGKSHGQRSLVGYSPWGHEESDTTEWLHFHFSLS